MARKENGKQKLLRLLEILIKNTDSEHGLALSEIIEKLSEYGISAERKSLYDDFLVLEEMGIPVMKTKSKKTEYYIDSFIFELAELKMLVDAVQSSKFITAKKSRDIISRLERFTSIHRSRELSRQVYVEDRVKTANPAAVYTVDAVHTAINSDRRLKFHYFEYDAQKKKRLRREGEFYFVSPLSLIWSEENYYLVAYEEESDKIKHFRIDKMLDVSPLSEKRSKNGICASFSPSDYPQKIFGMYGGKEELVTLECRERLAGIMIDRFGTEPTFHKTDFGFKFTVRVMLSPTFFAWVMGFGDEMRILSPESVRGQIREIIGKMASLYPEDKK